MAQHEDVRNYYTVEYETGFDSLGTNSVVRENRTGNKFLCKTIAKHQYQVDEADVRRKLGLLQELRHPNICELLEVYEDMDHWYLIYERTEGGDLQDLLERMSLADTMLDERAVAAYIESISVALAYCHSSQIVHRDLCPATILMTTALPDATVKLAAVGLSSIFDPRHERPRMLTSYEAPELTEHRNGALQSMAPDVWSLAALTYVLLVNRDLYGLHATPPDQARFVHGRPLFLEEDGWADRSPSSRDFLRRTLTSMDRRMTAAQCLTHRWLKLYAIPMPGPNQAPPVPPQEDARFLVVSCMLLLAPRVVSAEELDAARRAFQALDLDGDGLISRGELGLHLLRTPELEVDEDHAAAVLDLADVRNVGVIDLAAFLVALLAIREPDLDPERVAQQTFHALGAEANHGTVSLQQVAQVINTPVLRSLEIAARIHYMTLLQALPAVRSVPLEEFIYLFQQHVARGTSFAPEDPEDDDADDLDDGFPLHNVLGSTLSTLASFVAGPFDACMLCKNVGRRRHGSSSMKHDFLQSS